MLERESEAIRREALAGATLAEERTVALDLALDAFIEALQAYLDAREASSLERIVTQTFASADPPVAESLLLSVTRTVLDYARERRIDDPWLAPTLGAADARVREAAEQRRRAQRRRAEAVDETDRLIDSFLGRLDAHDPMTAEHSRAVSAWCARVARRLRLDNAAIARVARGGMIHDVGKMTTPKQVLLAPRRLDAAEREVIETHVLEGDRMLASMRPLADLRAMVRSHHERIDGKGYPDGLRASQIDMGVRIVSVADSFNAMIGRRPYRLPAPPSRALDELAAASGTQFDPEIVEAMIDVVSGHVH
ncbi:MAG: HD domain-containing protein [Candidatus Eremiobacteraeota bacterium]|nr:HD domain-containing protein [Candidatus Eremiobacteraeota bacterium]